MQRRPGIQGTKVVMTLVCKAGSEHYRVRITDIRLQPGAGHTSILLCISFKPALTAF